MMDRGGQERKYVFNYKPSAYIKILQEIKNIPLISLWLYSSERIR
jgi:hypothetical protein